MRRSISLLAFCALAACPAVAHADASSWMFVGGGVVASRMAAEVGTAVAGEDRSKLDPTGAMTFDIGVGTSPDGPIIVGGLFKITPFFGSGTDFGFSLRGAMHSFQAGDFGLALDLGGYARYWDAGSVGGTAAVVLGAPLGLQLSLQGLMGTNDALGIGAIAGIDFLRLTTQRQSLLRWWPNPSPAQQAPRESARR
jgi:hypothetical protein